MSDVMRGPGQETNYFGSCPECGHADRYLNFHRDHWFVCDEHEVRWWVGSNHFSSWRDEKEEDWEANGRLLLAYREVDLSVGQERAASVPTPREPRERRPTPAKSRRCGGPASAATAVVRGSEVRDERSDPWQVVVLSGGGLRSRLRRLEHFGGCPGCEDARETLLAEVVFGGTDTPTRCPHCSRDVRPTVFDVDRIVAEEEQRRGNEWGA